MNRRLFLSTSAAATAAAAFGTNASAATQDAAAGRPFALDYAPHFGMFGNHAGSDPIEELRFMHAQGFRSMEDNGMSGRSVEEQERIGKEMERLGMRMGVFVGAPGVAFGNNGLAAGRKDTREQFLAEIKNALEVQKRVNAKWCTVVPGELDHRLEMGYQTANVVDILRRGAELCEKTGLIMVLEPLNPWRDHPGMFLSKIPQAFEICRAVDSPSCKILFDIYHQQITEGNLIPNIDKAWSEIAYFQIGDNPGRNEPTTGEIHYGNVFRHIKAKGYTGVLGMEHGNSKDGKEGELAVIAAYRATDPPTA